MSELLEPIETRRAKRALSDRPISRKTAEIILNAAHLAPSCANSQPWRLIAVDDPETLARVKEHLTRGNYWAKPSSLIVGIASRHDLDCEIPDGRQYYLFGCGLAAMNLMLQATALDLIAHPIAGFRQRGVKETLGVPDGYTVIALIIIGHTNEDHSTLSDKHRAEETSERTRRPLDEVLGWNRFASQDPQDST